MTDENIAPNPSGEYYAYEQTEVDGQVWVAPAGTPLPTGSHPRYIDGWRRIGDAKFLFEQGTGACPEHQPGPPSIACGVCTPSIPAIGVRSEGRGELAGGDVQGVQFHLKKRRPSRHDQRTPLPGDPAFETFARSRERTVWCTDCVERCDLDGVCPSCGKVRS